MTSVLVFFFNSTWKCYILYLLNQPMMKLFIFVLALSCECCIAGIADERGREFFIFSVKESNLSTT